MHECSVCACMCVLCACMRVLCACVHVCVCACLHACLHVCIVEGGGKERDEWGSVPAQFCKSF